MTNINVTSTIPVFERYRFLSPRNSLDIMLKLRTVSRNEVWSELRIETLEQDFMIINYNQFDSIVELSQVLTRDFAAECFKNAATNR